MLGTHVMRLATCPTATAVCTTHIPTAIGPTAASPCSGAGDDPRPDSTPKEGRPHDGQHRAARGPRHLRVRLGGLRHRRRHRPAGPVRGGRPRHLGEEVRAAVDARHAPQGPSALRAQADADVRRRPVGHRLRQHQVLRALHGEAGQPAGRSCPRTSRTPTTAWASRRRRSSAWSPAWPPSTSPRWSTTRSARTSRSRASSSWTPTRACVSTRSCSRSTSAPSSPSGTTSSPR